MKRRNFLALLAVVPLAPKMPLLESPMQRLQRVCADRGIKLVTCPKGWIGFFAPKGWMQVGVSLDKRFVPHTLLMATDVSDGTMALVCDKIESGKST